VHLARVLDHLRRPRAAASARPTLAVFDLDSTLLSTQQRNHVILREFAARPDAPDALREIAARLTVDDMRWNAIDDVRAAGFSDEAVLKDFRGFWFRRFFSSEYLRHDEPLPGAPAFVRDVHAHAHVVYLTGRDEPNMGAGTRESLAAHGFPVAERTRVILKPRFDEPDLAFKRRAIEDLVAMGDVLAAFENEPANANLFAERFPEAEVVFLDTVHSPGAPPLHTRILRVRDFRATTGP
jgi:hypothetical protein